MGAQSTILKWDIARTKDSATVGAGFTVVGTPFTFPARIVRIVNASTQGVSVSVDGTNTYDFVPSNTSVIYDCGTNRGNSAPAMDIQKGTQIFVAGTAGVGTIYVIVLYAFDPPSKLPGE